MSSGRRVVRALGLGCIVAVVCWVPLGCSGEDSAGAGATSTTAAEGTSTTLPTMSDEEFAELADDFTGSVESAGTDLCELVEVATVSFSVAAANPDQVRQTVEMMTSVMEALAATEPVDEDNAEALRQTARRLSAAARSADHSIGFLESKEALEILAGEEFQQALNAYHQRALEACDGPALDGDVAENEPSGDAGS